MESSGRCPREATWSYPEDSPSSTPVQTGVIVTVLWELLNGME